jgi:uncharacterized protein (TIGR03437 family)
MERKAKIRLAKSAVILAAVPFLIHAYEYGPDAGAAGVPRENGSCNQVGCHTGTTVNAGGGSVSVTFPNELTYTPGTKQHLVVTITDPAQRRWGFELTARLAGDSTKMAGTFSPTDRFTQLICSSADLVRQVNAAATCPANLPLSYIEHTQAGYDRLQANPGTYEFDWNPPADDVGQIIIYVAGNAANGDLTSNGDHIYTASYTLSAGAAVPSKPAPAISDGGILHAATMATAGLPNAGIAQGSVFVINGSNLGPDGATVQVNVNGTTVTALITAASANQITAIMPSSVATGSGTVTVSVNGQVSAGATVQIMPATFGIYTLNGAGTGPAQIVDSDGNAITLAKPAQPGGVVTLTGTGIGPITGDDLAPSKQDVSSSVAVYVGTEQASVQYAGRSGAAPGQDQITFTVPADAITGCYVPVSVVVKNVTSNFASMAVAPSGSACSDANGFTADQVQKIQGAGGNTNVATLKLTRVASSSGSVVDSGSATFAAYTPAQLASSLGPAQTSSAGGCLVFPFTGSSPSVNDPTQPQALNAGSAVSISGPNGVKQLTSPQGGSAGSYTAQLATGGASYLDPGTYTFTTSGGSDVGAIEGQIVMPAAIQWTNASSAATVDRTQGLTVNWTGGDPNGFVTISGYSTLSSGNAGAIFSCTAATSAGTFTVPAAVTQALPASTTGGLTVTGVSAPVPFTAQGVDVGLATAASGVSQPAAFQ